MTEKQPRKNGSFQFSEFSRGLTGPYKRGTSQFSGTLFRTDRNLGRTRALFLPEISVRQNAERDGGVMPRDKGHPPSRLE